MSHVSHRSTLPPPPDRVGRLTGTAAVSVHATSIAGGTQRDPEGTSREPRRRCYGHRRGISLPKAPYQNAARMSRGAEGTTEASGRRDQAGLAARKRRVGAVRGAVPAQNEPKSDRRRAKTPMNRRKSRLRRRAAPISPRETLSIGFRNLVSLLPAIQATGLLILAPAGLSPAEQASLCWTHNPAGRFPAPGSPVESCGSRTGFPVTTSGRVSRALAPGSHP